LTKEQKEGKWIWRYLKIDPDITWEEYKSKYWTTTWSGQITHLPGNIRL